MKTTLLILDETERLIALEALHNYVKYNLSPSSNYFKKSKLLSVIEAQTNGFRIQVSEEDVFFLCDALKWNGYFVLDDKQRAQRDSSNLDTYSHLSWMIASRSQNIFAFGNFEPKNYTSELRPFETFDFSQPRFLLIRFEKEQMEFIREFYRNTQETDAQYTERIQRAVEKENLDCEQRTNPVFKNMKYKAVLFSDLAQYKLKKDYSYHT